MQGLPIKNVYFKVKGKNEVVASAKFIEVTPDNPSTKRLRGNENLEGLFYYGFRDLALLQRSLPLSSLRRFGSGKPVLNTFPGPAIISDL